MRRRRVRVEFEDGRGGKYSISLNGDITRDKVLKVMDMIDLLGGDAGAEPAPIISADTRFGKLYQLIDKKFPFGQFTSLDVLEAYEDEYQQPVRLSTISTYLTRLSDRGLLAKQKNGASYVYRRLRVPPSSVEG